MIPKTHQSLISLPFSVCVSVSKNYKGCMLKGGRRVCVMHAIKGGWARQTFALAKRHESGETKSRTRPSKQERKEMVECFIKKYQNLNNGSFPSLRLTQKEVGGSFYTIREIFREIIQENRVLGPAKLLPEEQNADQLLEKFPLGTISTEPETSLSMSPNGSPFLYDQQQDTSEEEEVYLISDGLYAKPEQQGFYNEQVINRSHLIVTSKECDDIKVAKAQVSEAMETEKNVEEVVASRTKVTQMADVIVETFPLQPVSQPTDNLDGNTSDVITQPIGSNGTLADENVEKVLLGPGYVTSKSDGMNLSNNSCLVDDKEEENLAAGLLLEGDSNLVSEKALKTVADLPLGSSNSSGIKEGVVHDAQVDIDVAVKSSHNDDKAIAQTKVVNASNGRQTKTLNGTYGSTNSRETITQEEVTGSKTNVQPSGSSQKGNNPTVDRIDLKSWKGDSKKRAESETNPVLATFKSLVDAFVKFWS